MPLPAIGGDVLCGECNSLAYMRCSLQTVRLRVDLSLSFSMRAKTSSAEESQ